MRISAKGRYGLSAMIFLARHARYDCVTVLRVSEELGISKIYLEQVFALLKKAGLVLSSKGSSGGYQLSREPRAISALDILTAIETSLFEKTERTSSQKSEAIDDTLDSLVWQPLDTTVFSFLSGVSLERLAEESELRENSDAGMFYI